jgi:sigma-B regulation protein RsbU (phosphoserine phosphatase)
MAHDGTKKFMTLLVVEDNPSERAALAATGRRLGFEVITAATADDGRRWLLEISPDVVLCDYEIPGGGFSVLDLARTLGMRPPFVLMTGVADPRVRVEALRRGANLFLSKPLTITRIDDAIRRVLSGGAETA